MNAVPKNIKPLVVDSPDALQESLAGWRQAPALAFDTEFVRERTFFPGLGLIQISDGERHVLMDPLAVDPEPLRQILLAPETVKVFHSCGEDLEVLYHRFEVFPRPIFDTQIAAAFAGLGGYLSYGGLVAELFDVKLPQGATRSNWLRRPLTGEQKRYAALDVAYLLPAYHKLLAVLRELDREVWVREEIEQLADASRFLPDPESVYLSFARWNMSRRELAVLRTVAEWRERQARYRDLPRNFVLPKAALAQLARQRPRELRHLAAIDGLRQADRQRHGETLLHLIADADRLSSHELPPKLRRPLDLTRHRDRVHSLREAIAAKAAELKIPPELLANRRTAEDLIRRKIASKTPPIPESMTAWRRRILSDLVSSVLPTPH